MTVKMVMKKVRTKQKVVAEIEVPIYVDTSELLEFEPAERILAMFNNANHVRLMGNERAKFSGTRTGKKMRAKIAFNCLTVEQLQSVAGDMDALDALLDSDDIQALVDAKLAESAGGLDDGTDGETVEGEEVE